MAEDESETNRKLANSLNGLLDWLGGIRTGMDMRADVVRRKDPKMHPAAAREYPQPEIRIQGKLVIPPGDGIEIPKRQVTVAALLRRAGKYLRRKGGWCRGAFCRDENGKALADYESGAAKSFCVAGAIRRAGAELGKGVMPARLVRESEVDVYRMGKSLTENRKMRYLDSWNDHKRRTREEVLRAVDLAILAHARPKKRKRRNRVVRLTAPSF